MIECIGVVSPGAMGSAVGSDPQEQELASRRGPARAQPAAALGAGRTGGPRGRGHPTRAGCRERPRALVVPPASAVAVVPRCCRVRRRPRTRATVIDANAISPVRARSSPARSGRWRGLTWTAASSGAHPAPGAAATCSCRARRRPTWCRLSSAGTRRHRERRRPHRGLRPQDVLRRLDEGDLGAGPDRHPLRGPAPGGRRRAGRTVAARSSPDLLAWSQSEGAVAGRAWRWSTRWPRSAGPSRTTGVPGGAAEVGERVRVPYRVQGRRDRSVARRGRGRRFGLIGPDLDSLAGVAELTRPPAARSRRRALGSPAVRGGGGRPARPPARPTRTRHRSGSDRRRPFSTQAAKTPGA